MSALTDIVKELKVIIWFRYLISEINECASLPCQNGGRCFDLDEGGYRCDCTVAYGGVNCEEREYLLTLVLQYYTNAIWFDGKYGTILSPVY